MSFFPCPAWWSCFATSLASVQCPLPPLLPSCCAVSYMFWLPQLCQVDKRSVCGGDAGDPDEWDNIMKLNVMGPLRLTRRLAPSIVERTKAAGGKGGAVINTGALLVILTYLLLASHAIISGNLTCLQGRSRHQHRCVA